VVEVAATLCRSSEYDSKYGTLSEATEIYLTVLSLGRHFNQRRVTCQHWGWHSTWEQHGH